MNLAFAECLFALIILIAAYFISHTINGSIQAYVTWKLGDDTAKESGFMSLNPVVHIDLLGFLFLIFLGIGWMQTVPIDPYAFLGKWRHLRLGLAYATEAIVSVLLAIIALFLSVYFYGFVLTHMVLFQLFKYYSKLFLIFFSTTGRLNIAELFSQQSTVTIVIVFLLASIVYLNIIIATISSIFNAFRYALVIGFERGYSYMEYAEYLAILGPLLVLFVFGDSLLGRFLYIAQYVASLFALLLGAHI